MTDKEKELEINKNLEELESLFTDDVENNDLDSITMPNSNVSQFQDKSSSIDENSPYPSSRSNIITPEPTVLEFKSLIKDIAENPNVIALRERTQHDSGSRYGHCVQVAYYSYAICKKLNLDYKAAARAGMLHDFYYYDWRNRKLEGVKRLHAFRHPAIALKNAKDLFEINEKEADIIKNHMWPLTFYRLPKYKETYIITLVDKYCATKEKVKSLVKRFKLYF